ncbi:alpha/beta-hydrolase [Ramaria rubella]|nr:alpha/beta-hydrolase [Ramaria rubella]
MTGNIKYTPLNHYGRLTTFESVTLIPIFLLIIARLLVTALLWPLQGVLSFKRTMWRMFVRVLCPMCTFPQLQKVCPNTGDAYRSHMRSWSKTDKRCFEKSDTLKDNAKLHWIGNPAKAKNVVLYLHGGGYVLPALDGHLGIVKHLHESLDVDPRNPTAIALLEYSLINFAPWPTQLIQTYNAILHLESCGYSHSQISLAGDSAGGQLILALIGHYLHGHPSLPPPKITTAFKAAYLASPWTVLSCNAPSYPANEGRDLIPVYCLKRWGDAVVSSKISDDPYFLEPGHAPSSWWNGIENVVKAIKIHTSKGECMFDDTFKTIKILEKGCKDPAFIQTVIDPTPAIHNELLGEFASGEGPGPAAKVAVEFLREP